MAAEPGAVSDDTPADELVQRIRQAVVASLPPGVRVRQWGTHSNGTRLGSTNMMRYLVEYAPDVVRDC